MIQLQQKTGGRGVHLSTPGQFFVPSAPCVCGWHHFCCYWQLVNSSSNVGRQAGQYAVWYMLLGLTLEFHWDVDKEKLIPTDDHLTKMQQVRRNEQLSPFGPLLRTNFWQKLFLPRLKIEKYNRNHVPQLLQKFVYHLKFIGFRLFKKSYLNKTCLIKKIIFRFLIMEL